MSTTMGSETTVRRWLQRGAPTVRPGEAGRGKGALVDVVALERWRTEAAKPQPDARATVLQLAALLRDYHRAGDHRLVGLRDDAAQLLYAAFLEYVAGRLGVEDVEL